MEWLQTKVEVFGCLLGEAAQCIHVCGEDIDTLDTFTCLGNVVHNNDGSQHEVLWWIGLPGPWCYGFTQHEYLALSVPVQTDKDSNFQITGDPCLTVWLNTDLKRQIDVFGNKCLYSILGIIGMTLC